MARKLGRKKPHRDHLLRNLVTSLVLYERVKTTEAKAKEIKPIIDRLITIGKKGDLAARRQLAAYLFDANAVRKMMDEIAPRYTKRTSGYTRLYHVGNRVGDAAPVAILQLISGDTAEAKPKKETKKESEKEPAAAAAK